MLKECQRTTLFSFLDAVRKLLAEGIEQHSLQELEAEVNLALALMERDFPIDIQVYKSHYTYTAGIVTCTLFSPGYNTAPSTSCCQWHEALWTSLW